MKFRFFFTVFLSLFFISFAENSVMDNNKIYIDQGNAALVTTNGLLVFINDQIMEVPALYSDENGVYFDSSAFNVVWKCKCGRWNFDNTVKCPKCGRYQ